jgi:diphosphomevalonate decarboxylase
MASYEAVAYAMQGLVKYHGLRDWDLRLPFHDSISVNTTCMMTEAKISDEGGGVFTDGRPNPSANSRFDGIVRRLNSSSRFDDYRVESRNVPEGKPKGIGYSSSAGAALTILAQRMIKGDVGDLKQLSRVARLFAASASRSLVGGFSRLYAADDDEGSYAERFADDKVMDLRMVIVPLSSDVRTEDAHREVMTSPFFRARVESAQKRCNAVEKAILGNDLKTLGVLVERDTMELHSLTMTGENRLVIMTEDTIRVLRAVRGLRENGTEAYFSMQTGPSVFINTSGAHQSKVFEEVSKLGYRCYTSGVGGEARLVGRRRGVEGG